LNFKLIGPMVKILLEHISTISSPVPSTSRVKTDHRFIGCDEAMDTGLTETEQLVIDLATLFDTIPSITESEEF
jgi:hypothetical protein